VDGANFNETRARFIETGQLDAAAQQPRAGSRDVVNITTIIGDDEEEGSDCAQARCPHSSKLM
jgi:hypothetical protein